MKNIMRICLFTLMAGLAWPALAQPKVGVVDMNKIIEGFYKAKAVKAALKDHVAELDKEGQSLMDELKKANEDYKRAIEESNNMAVSAEEREKSKKVAEAKFKEAQDKQQNLELFNRRADAQLREKQRQMTEKIVDEVRTVISAQAKAAGYSLVLDVTGESVRGTPVVLYTNGENDLTTAVLGQLNNLAPSSTGAEEKKSK